MVGLLRVCSVVAHSPSVAWSIGCPQANERLALPLGKLPCRMGRQTLILLA
jgi:hypothetical protein